MIKTRVSAYAPASIGNVSVGFDCLGLAITHPGDTVHIEVGDDPGIRLVDIQGDEGVLPKSVERNVVGVVIQSMLDALGRNDAMAVRLDKGLPLKSGLGSSAASAVAAAVAANAFFGNPFTKKELLPFTMEGERLACGAPHVDNVAPALLGGIVLIRSTNPLDVISITYPKNIYCAVVHPEMAIATRDARAVLPRTISRATAIRQSSHLAAFIAGLQQGDMELIARSMVDFIAEPARKSLIPHFDAVKRAAMASGALGCGISGSGPSMFALCDGEKIAQRSAETMANIFNDNKIQCETYVSQICENGAVVRSKK